MTASVPSLQPSGVQLLLQMLPQPDDITCGPTALHALYRYYGDDMPLEQVVREVPMLEHGGTLAAMLGCHALSRGYDATIYTYNLQTFDPTWFLPGVDLADRLMRQREHKPDPKLQVATGAYLEFLRRGGEVRFEELTSASLRRHLARGRPILTGLSATYLYNNAREIPATDEPDDVRGQPVGHFVVLSGYDKETGTVAVADPQHSTPHADGHHYALPIARVIASILLGVLTYDGNLLLVRPRQPRRGKVR